MIAGRIEKLQCKAAASIINATGQSNVHSLSDVQACGPCGIVVGQSPDFHIYCMHMFTELTFTFFQLLATFASATELVTWST